MNETQARSYALGCDIGNNFRKMGLDIEGNSFLEGLLDAMSMKMKMSPEELSYQFKLINEELQAKNEALSKAQKQVGADFLEANKQLEGVVETPSGLQYKVIKMGDGKKPKATDTVTVHYHGTTIDGKIFDSSVERGQQISFALNQVIEGWTEGLQLMPIGSKFMFYIPSDLAYGEQSPSPDIKPGAVLIFEVELFGIN